MAEFAERVPGESHHYEIKSIIFDKKTAHQHIVCVDSVLYGKILFIDGYSQSAEKDEYIYHEMLVHPVLNRYIGTSRKLDVLIIGGGEGATLREIAKYRTAVNSITMVDIDGELVEECKKHMPEWGAGSWDDPRLELIIEDIWDYFKHCEKKFDVIVVDLVDPDDDESFYAKYFLEQLNSILKPDGNVVMQIGEIRPWDTGAADPMYDLFIDVFKTGATVYKTFVPVYLGEWGFICTNRYPHVCEFGALSQEAMTEVSTRFFSPLIHQASVVRRHR